MPTTPTTPAPMATRSNYSSNNSNSSSSHGDFHAEEAEAPLVAAEPTPLTSSPHVPHWSSSEMELSNHHRLMSAAMGALLTSLVVTPFDVVKTRLQAQINLLDPSKSSPSKSLRPTVAASHALLKNCSHYRMHTGIEDTWCNNCFRPAVNESKTPTTSYSASINKSLQSSSSRSSSLKFNGAIDAASKLIRHEGIFSLWRGLSPTILMSIPSTVVYFSMYDKVKIAIARMTPQKMDQVVPGSGQHIHLLQTLSPPLAGVCARAITTTLVSPIELVRTKSMSLSTSVSMGTLLREEMSRGGFLSLWRGVGPTLMRDVPFSAIYWSGYEYGKWWMLRRWGVDVNVESRLDNPNKSILASFLAGAGSGMISAACTHPFDLIKTRRQIELYHLGEQPQSITSSAVSHSHHHHHHPQHVHSAACAHPGVPTLSLRPPLSASTLHHVLSSSSSSSAAPAASARPVSSTTWSVGRSIIAEEGYLGLFSGLSARITRIAPACAIMIGTYEAAKMYFGSEERTSSSSQPDFSE